MQTNNNNFERIARKPPSKLRQLRDQKRSKRVETRKQKRGELYANHCD